MSPEILEPLLAKPWVAGACGPDSFDCWGLVRWFYSTHYNVQLVAHTAIDATSARARVEFGWQQTTAPTWHATAHPQEGDAVAMSKGGAIHHVGLYAGNRTILHTLPGAGVTRQLISSLKQNGFSIFQFYRHESRDLR